MTVLPDTMNLDEYLRLTGASNPRKYRNQITETDGIRFDSAAEARRYQELKLLEAAGTIADLTLQPKYELQEAFTTKRGKRVRAITYTGDFQYRESGVWVVEDVKGGKATQTQVFRLKAKLFEFRYPDIELRIVAI